MEGGEGGEEAKPSGDRPEVSDAELLAGEELVLPLLSPEEVSEKLMTLQGDNDTVTPIAQLNDGTCLASSLALVPLPLLRPPHLVQPRE